MYSQSGEIKEATDYSEKDVELLWNIGEGERLELAESYSRFGIECAKMGQYDKAIEYYIKTMNNLSIIFGEEPTNFAASYSNWMNK